MMTQAHGEVSCTARLHLGFLDLTDTRAREFGRRFGSVGLSLDGPETHVLVRRADVDRVTGAERERATRVMRTIREALGLPGCHAVTVSEAIPAHSGLGSGTQLALAVATALRQAHGLAADPRGDAARLGRGARSGIGIGTFVQGGLVVDGGVGPQGGLPPLLVRHAFPESWRIVLVMDAAASGLSGERERAGFATLAPMPDEESGTLCRLLLMQALPALAEDDLRAFGDAITRMQDKLGRHFAPVQGGLFTSARVAAAIEVLRAAGGVGLGQSSWGPTGFAFFRGDAAAEHAAAQARAHCPALDFTIRRALNRGAMVAGGE
jgi:beta-RFAP synthase